MCAFERSEKGMKFNMNKEEKLKENIRATMKIEGFNMDDKDFDVVNRYLNNDITLDEGIKEIKNSFSNL